MNSDINININIDAKGFVETLYRVAVDGRNIEALSDYLADNVRFRIGNHSMLHGKNAVLEANRAFFDSISSMSHQIERVWLLGNVITCSGTVDYLRLNGTKHTAVFATFLTLNRDKIEEYIVYADLSGL